MRGIAWRDGVRRALRACAGHWVRSSLVVLFILVGAIVGTGITWNHLGVLAQFLVAVIALGGYIFSYKLYREQEEHKYKAAVVAAFPVPEDAIVSVPGKHGWIPGFARRVAEADEILAADFFLENISESPVTNVRMNFYLHDCERFDEQPRKPAAFFEDDVLMVDGLAKGAEARFMRTLRPHLISAGGQLANGSALRAFDFSQLFLSPIPSETPDKPARWSSWTLVMKYQNLQGEPFFSAYKSEGPTVSLGQLQQKEYFRMVFFGSFSGDYLKDDKDHQFIANRGFPNATVAPDWRCVKAVVQEIAASRAVASAPSNLPPSF